MSSFMFFRAASFFIGGLFNEPLCIFLVASFFIGGLFDEPLYIFWVAFFSSEVFLMSPFVFFEVGSFFIGGSFNEPLCVFLVASFFIRGLFDLPMNLGSESTPLFVALLVCVEVLVECQANLVSYFDLVLS
jgi:hypothetical protein